MSIDERSGPPVSGTRTVSPGKAIIRFTSINLGLIGELIKRENVYGKSKHGTERNDD